jgi:hypothetical protein
MESGGECGGDSVGSRSYGEKSSKKSSEKVPVRKKMLKIKNKAGRQGSSGGVAGVGGGKRRSVDQLRAETRQVGLLQVFFVIFACIG